MLKEEVGGRKILIQGARPPLISSLRNASHYSTFTNEC